MHWNSLTKYSSVLGQCLLYQLPGDVFITTFEIRTPLQIRTLQPVPNCFRSPQNCDRDDCVCVRESVSVQLLLLVGLPVMGRHVIWRPGPTDLWLLPILVF